MSMADVHGDEPWYRNQWVWLIIAIPAMTVIGCLFTVYLAISNPDFIVRDAPVETRAPDAYRE